MQLDDGLKQSALAQVLRYECHKRLITLMAQCSTINVTMPPDQEQRHNNILKGRIAELRALLNDLRLGPDEGPGLTEDESPQN